MLTFYRSPCLPRSLSCSSGGLHWSDSAFSTPTVITATRHDCPDVVLTAVIMGWCLLPGRSAAVRRGGRVVIALDHRLPPPPPLRTLLVLSNAQHRPHDGRSNRSCNCLAGRPVLARGTLNDKPATAQHSPEASFEGELTAAHNDTGPTPNTAMVIRPNPGLHHTTRTLSNSTVSTSRCPQRDASRVCSARPAICKSRIKGDTRK